MTFDNQLMEWYKLCYKPQITYGFFFLCIDLMKYKESTQQITCNQRINDMVHIDLKQPKNGKLVPRGKLV